MKLALIGCGLLGGSLAKAWRSGGQVESICGFDHHPEVVRQACDLGVIDTGASSLADAVRGADLVALAIPVCALAGVMADLSNHLQPGVILTDVGSTKVNIIQAARHALNPEQLAYFVPAHPIAGGALPGVEHAHADLFNQKWVITTPDESTNSDALTRVEALWQQAGARVQRMIPEEHDDIFAAVSHLPHLLAFALVHQIANQADGARKLQFAGAGFRDFTRIAASDPAMWRDISLANREALGNQLSAFRQTLDTLIKAVQNGDATTLDQLFSLASSVRRQQFPSSTS
jgi:prephenate dehydrogenase